jgi:hypothetical protein
MFWPLLFAVSQVFMEKRFDEGWEKRWVKPQRAHMGSRFAHGRL